MAEDKVPVLHPDSPKRGWGSEESPISIYSDSFVALEVEESKQPERRPLSASAMAAIDLNVQDLKLEDYKRRFQKENLYRHFSDAEKQIELNAMVCLCAVCLLAFLVWYPLLGQRKIYFQTCSPGLVRALPCRVILLTRTR